MKFIIYPAGIYQANCYIIYDEKTNEGFIIDPGGDADGILAEARKYNISVKYLVLTHGHFDHTGAVNDIKSRLGIPLFMNERDNEFLLDSGIIKLIKKKDSITADAFLKEGDILNFGNEKAVVHETPGHTPGGITICIGGSIFTGDTLFENSIGRTDLPGGSYSTLIKSINEKLMALPDETCVYPGHGPSTTIGWEKKNNPFLK